MSNLPVEHRVLRKDRENMITSYRMVFLAACFACLRELCSVPNGEAHDVYVILISIGQVLTPNGDDFPICRQVMSGHRPVIGHWNQLDNFKH